MRDSTPRVIAARATLVSYPLSSADEVTGAADLSRSAAYEALEWLCAHGQVGVLRHPSGDPHGTRLHYLTQAGVEGAAATIGTDPSIIIDDYGLTERALWRRLPRLDHIRAGRAMIIDLAVGLRASGGRCEGGRSGPLYWRYWHVEETRVHGELFARKLWHTLQLDGAATIILPVGALTTDQGSERGHTIAMLWAPDTGRLRQVTRTRLRLVADAQSYDVAVERPGQARPHRLPMVLAVVDDIDNVRRALPDALCATRRDIEANGPLGAVWQWMPSLNNRHNIVHGPLLEMLERARVRPGGARAMLPVAPGTSFARPATRRADAPTKPRLARQVDALTQGDRPCPADRLPLLAAALSATDRAILAAIASHPLLTTEILARIVSNAALVVPAALVRLQRQGLVSLWQPPERPYGVWLVRPRGVNLLAMCAGVTLEDYTRICGVRDDAAVVKSAGVRRWYLRHALAISDVLSAFRIARIDHGGAASDAGGRIRWVYRVDPEAVLTLRTDKGRALLKPDLILTDPTSPDHRHYYVEVDTGTMTHRQMIGKLKRYYRYRRQQNRQVTVLLVTTGGVARDDSRGANLLRTNRTLATTMYPGQAVDPLDMRVANLADLLRRGPYAAIWRDDTRGGGCGLRGLRGLLDQHGPRRPARRF